MMRYIAEFNRARGDNIRLVARRLRGLGLRVMRLAHRTTLSIVRPRSMSWADFTALIETQLQSRRGSVLLCSVMTGNVFICNNSGNRPRRFVRQ